MSENRRNDIYAVKYIAATDASYKKYPFYAFATVMGSLTDIEPLAKFVFEETLENNGQLFLQKFSALCADTSEAKRTELEQLTHIPLLLVLFYTNGERRVVGTPDRPVEMLMSEAGSPKVITLSFQRYCNQRAPLFQSF
jgi:hypothetical protein